MKMEINSLIKLSNDERYIVLNELDYKSHKYYLTMGIINDKEIDSSKVVIIEEIKDDEGYYIEKVIDSDLLLDLTKMFKEQM